MEARGIKLSKEFKDLYFNMISIKPEKRPNIHKILNDPWFKEIDDLKNKKSFDKCENKICELFSSLREEVKNFNKKKMETNNKESECAANNNRSISEESIFSPNILPTYINTPLNVNNC